MFIKNDPTKNSDLLEVSKFLASNVQTGGPPVVLCDEPEYDTPIAVVQMELLSVLCALIKVMAMNGVQMDALLAKKLKIYDAEFKKRVMGQFVRLRRSEGMLMEKDDEFLRTGDSDIFLNKSVEGAMV